MINPSQFFKKEEYRDQKRYADSLKEKEITWRKSQWEEWRGKSPLIRTGILSCKPTLGRSAEPSLHFQNDTFENSRNHILIILQEIKSTEKN